MVTIILPPGGLIPSNFRGGFQLVWKRDPILMKLIHFRANVLVTITQIQTYTWNGGSIQKTWNTQASFLMSSLWPMNLQIVLDRIILLHCFSYTHFHSFRWKLHTFLSQKKRLWSKSWWEEYDVLVFFYKSPGKSWTALCPLSFLGYGIGQLGIANFPQPTHCCQLPRDNSTILFNYFK